MRSKLMAGAMRWIVVRLVNRPPDFIIGGAEHPYMLRWYVIPRNRVFNVYRHVILRSDDDRALHDHPWWSLSVCLYGGMVELLSDDMRHRRRITAGHIQLRSAKAAHRLVICPGEICETLFITGPKIREWGFHCPRGWRHWREFVRSDDSGSVGPGCE